MMLFGDTEGLRSMQKASTDAAVSVADEALIIRKAFAVLMGIDP